MHFRSKSAGFTLIEILAVISILGLLMTLAIPMFTKARAQANMVACQQNLRQVAGTMRAYVDGRKKGRWPKLSGIQWLLVLARDGELRGESLDVFVCPNTQDVTYLDEADPTPGTGYSDFENIDVNCISYAGRDNKTFPLKEDKADRMVIAADDNDNRYNHEHITNFVYMDARISTADVSDYTDELGEEAEWVPVGPESPHEELAKLLND